MSPMTCKSLWHCMILIGQNFSINMLPLRICKVLPLDLWHHGTLRIIIKWVERTKRQLERYWHASCSTGDLQSTMQSPQDCYLHQEVNITKFQSLRISLEVTFPICSELVHQCCEVKYPKHDTPASLVNDFILFFGDKIRKICHDTAQVAHHYLVLKMPLLIVT